MNKEYYTYCAYGIHGELLYIGYGKGNRYQHCNNGMSSNKGLNRYYFTNGEEGSITVKILHHFDNKTTNHLRKVVFAFLNTIKCYLANAFKSPSNNARLCLSLCISITLSFIVLASSNVNFLPET